MVPETPVLQKINGSSYLDGMYSYCLQGKLLEETQVLKRNSSEGVFPKLLALQSLIQSLLSLAGTCQLVPQIAASREQRGGVRLSKEAVNAAQGNIKHISESLF